MVEQLPVVLRAQGYAIDAVRRSERERECVRESKRVLERARVKERESERE